MALFGKKKKDDKESKDGASSGQAGFGGVVPPPPAGAMDFGLGAHVAAPNPAFTPAAAQANTFGDAAGATMDPPDSSTESHSFAFPDAEPHPEPVAEPSMAEPFPSVSEDVPTSLDMVSDPFPEAAVSSEPDHMPDMVVQVAPEGEAFPSPPTFDEEMAPGFEDDMGGPEPQPDFSMETPDAGGSMAMMAGADPQAEAVSLWDQPQNAAPQTLFSSSGDEPSTLSGFSGPSHDQQPGPMGGFGLQPEVMGGLVQEPPAPAATPDFDFPPAPVEDLVEGPFLSESPPSTLSTVDREEPDAAPDMDFGLSSPGFAEPAEEGPDDSLAMAPEADVAPAFELEPAPDFSLPEPQPQSQPQPDFSAINEPASGLGTETTQPEEPTMEGVREDAPSFDPVGDLAPEAAQGWNPLADAEANDPAAAMSMDLNLANPNEVAWDPLSDAPSGSGSMALDALDESPGSGYPPVPSDWDTPDQSGPVGGWEELPDFSPEASPEQPSIDDEEPGELAPGQDIPEPDPAELQSLDALESMLFGAPNPAGDEQPVDVTDQSPGLAHTETEATADVMEPPADGALDESFLYDFQAEAPPPDTTPSDTIIPPVDEARLQDEGMVLPTHESSPQPSMMMDNDPAPWDPQVEPMPGCLEDMDALVQPLATESHATEESSGPQPIEYFSLEEEVSPGFGDGDPQWTEFSTSDDTVSPAPSHGEIPPSVELTDLASSIESWKSELGTDWTQEPPVSESVQPPEVELQPEPQELYDPEAAGPADHQAADPQWFPVDATMETSGGELPAEYAPDLASPDYDPSTPPMSGMAAVEGFYEEMPEWDMEMDGMEAPAEAYEPSGSAPAPEGLMHAEQQDVPPYDYQAAELVMDEPPSLQAASAWDEALLHSPAPSKPSNTPEMLEPFELGQDFFTEEEHSPDNTLGVEPLPSVAELEEQVLEQEEGAADMDLAASGSLAPGDDSAQLAEPPYSPSEALVYDAVTLQPQLKSPVPMLMDPVEYMAAKLETALPLLPGLSMGSTPSQHAEPSGSEILPYLPPPAEVNLEEGRQYVGPPPSPSSDDLTLLARQPLGQVGELYMVLLKETSAMMVQDHRTGNMMVLKIFPNNPLDAHPQFQASLEGRAGGNELYLVRAGSWHGIVVASESGISIHTEF